MAIEPISPHSSSVANCRGTAACFPNFAIIVVDSIMLIVAVHLVFTRVYPTVAPAEPWQYSTMDHVQNVLSTLINFF